VTFFIQEPPRSKIEGGGLQLNMLWKAFVQTFKHVDAKWLILIFAILSAASSKAYYVIQPVILDMSLTLNWFGSADMTKVILMGIVSAIASFSIGFASQHSHLVLEKLGAKKLLFMCCSMSFLGYILCGIFHGVWVGLLTLLMVFLSLGLSHVVVQTMMQERIASEIRATVLAMRSMVVSFTFFLVTIGFAWFIESYGFQIALLFTSAVVLIVGMISYKGIRFHKKDVPVISVLS
jgi:MFS family permease